jgi:hypothetical protein
MTASPIGAILITSSHPTLSVQTRSALCCADAPRSARTRLRTAARRRGLARGALFPPPLRKSGWQIHEMLSEVTRTCCGAREKVRKWRGFPHTAFSEVFRRCQTSTPEGRERKTELNNSSSQYLHAFSFYFVTRLYSCFASPLVGHLN